MHSQSGYLFAICFANLVFSAMLYSSVSNDFNIAFVQTGGRGGIDKLLTISEREFTDVNMLI